MWKSVWKRIRLHFADKKGEIWSVGGRQPKRPFEPEKPGNFMR